MTQKPDAAELLPCPFCSSVDVHLQWMSPDIPGIQEEDYGYGYDGPDRAEYYIECRGCALTTDSYLSGTTIVEKWNTRDTAERDALRREVEAGKEQLREFAEDVAYQYAYERNGALTTGGLSTMEYTFRILGWDDPHTLVALEGESRCIETH